jgi:ubiquinone/menaquinone biosynthesis C-methylase UbiE
MSVYDAMAPDFDRRRALPDGVPETIRHTVLGSGLPPRPRLLDLGAGTGRIGWPFVRAGDDYTGADLSFGMLRTFTDRHRGVRLTQADGAMLPFRDATFDAVMLIQVLSGVSGWRRFLADAVRVLRPAGALIMGRVVAPDDGVDAQMKIRLAAILHSMDIHPYRDTPRDDALSWLVRQMPDPTILTAADWVAERTPRGFIERHGSGARFSMLADTVRRDAMRRLGVWAADRFGSLDTVRAERHRFELIIHRHQQGTVT